MLFTRLLLVRMRTRVMVLVSEILMRMMAKSPADRFVKPDDLLDELTRVLGECTSGQFRTARSR